MSRPVFDGEMKSVAVDALQNEKFILEESIFKFEEPLVDVVIPALNEEGSIERVISEVKKYCGRVLIIDGHSTDGTVEVAEKLGAKVIVQNGDGKGTALREAFGHVDGDVVVVLDADGSMRPREIPRFTKAVVRGADFVKGSRFLPGGYTWDMSSIRRVGNRLFVFLVNRLWSGKYTDLCYGFMAFRKEALKELCSCLSSRRFEIETEICIKAKKLGLKTAEVPSVELRRRHGKSNLCTVRDGLRILRTIIGEIIRKGVFSST